MPPYGKQQKIERSIYRDVGGYEVKARAGKLTRSKRFPLDTPLKILRGWRDATATDLRDEAQPTNDARTLAGSIEQYRRATKPDAPTSASLNTWSALYGHLERRKLTPVLCQQAVDRWQADGKSAQTIYYRLLTLKKLWTHLDGPTVRTPVDAIHVSRTKSRRPVWVPDSTIAAVAKTLKQHEQPKSRKGQASGRGTLPDAKTRARFMVLASTGQRPKQMQMAQPEDVQLFEQPDAEGVCGIWLVRSAKGGDPVPVFLNQEQAAAWKLFIDADAWGEYDRRSFTRTLRRCGWPSSVRPYNLRHATALTLTEGGADLWDIASQFGHTSSQTTLSYTTVLRSRLKRLSSMLSGRFTEWLVDEESS